MSTITYPQPGPVVLTEAFHDHGVDFVLGPRCNLGRDKWRYGLRAITMHHTAGKDSLGSLQAWHFGGCNSLSRNGRYNPTHPDGQMVIVCWGSAWHSGDGGPWQGVAGEDSLHLVSWGIEMESLGGSRDDMTDGQYENAGRMLAALWSLGVPKQHTHRHADWTDATGPVTGPLRKRKFDSGPVRTTKGRKIDTRQTWAPTREWVDLGEKYELAERLWDGVVPSLEAIDRAELHDVANPAAWRLACRLADLGHYIGAVRPRYEQRYPSKAVARWQASIGAKPTGKYGPIAHQRIFQAA